MPPSRLRHARRASVTTPANFFPPNNNRSGGIRTHDFPLPRRNRYQAAVTLRNPLRNNAIASFRSFKNDADGIRIRDLRDESPARSAATLRRLGCSNRPRSDSNRSAAESESAGFPLPHRAILLICPGRNRTGGVRFKAERVTTTSPGILRQISISLRARSPTMLSRVFHTTHLAHEKTRSDGQSQRVFKTKSSIPGNAGDDPFGRTRTDVTINGYTLTVGLQADLLLLLLARGRRNASGWRLNRCNTNVRTHQHDKKLLRARIQFKYRIPRPVQ